MLLFFSFLSTEKKEIVVMSFSFRFMEIRDPIHGNIEIPPLEGTIIDSAPYQRLRQIKQLGFSEYSFPAATHNRYIHSLGAYHLAGEIFDAIFKKSVLSPEQKGRLRQTVKLACLLHDLGHGPLSHAVEELMPPLSELKMDFPQGDKKRRANHEDYTVKFITQFDEITEILSDKKLNPYGILPSHIVSLIDFSYPCDEGFFTVEGKNVRPVLSQIVSSQLDADRLDYLQRDSYFCGINYGKVDATWLISCMSYHEVGDSFYMGLSREALYAFEDFLLARHHMHLMIYFHYKSVIYERLFQEYIRSKKSSLSIPSDLKEYLNYTDYLMHEELRKDIDTNEWARRIVKKKPYKVLLDFHSDQDEGGEEVYNQLKESLDRKKIQYFSLSSSSYVQKPGVLKKKIYVLDVKNKYFLPKEISEVTKIFKKYKEKKEIHRIYVIPEKFSEAKSLLQKVRGNS